MVPTRDEALASRPRIHRESGASPATCWPWEAAMRAYARKYGEDEERWGIAGLLHDFDYERWPNHDQAPDAGHPFNGVAILRDMGVDEDIIHTILAHADYSGVEATTPMSRTLRAVDELTGFITACALVRPTRIEGMKTRSVRKKMKDKAFAAAVSRGEMTENCRELGRGHGRAHRLRHRRDAGCRGGSRPRRARSRLSLEETDHDHDRNDDPHDDRHPRIRLGRTRLPRLDRVAAGGRKAPAGVAGHAGVREPGRGGAKPAGCACSCRSWRR